MHLYIFVNIWFPLMLYHLGSAIMHEICGHEPIGTGTSGHDQRGLV